MAEPITPQERDALAAELALGVLEGEERAAALRLRLADGGFAAEVAVWEARLAPLGAGFAEVPAPDVWPAIERRLGSNAGGVRGLRLWRWTAIGSAALAASLAAVLVLRPLPAPNVIVRPAEQVVVASLDGGEKGAFLAAAYDPSAGELRIRAMRMPEHKGGMAPELWVIPADGVPRSLGMVAPKGMSRMKLPMPQRKLMLEGATLAITIEPMDGAPHQAPSSAPVAAGKISTI